MKVFLAGIMQGSIPGGEMHDQGYRGQLRSLVRDCLPDAEIVDPLALHPNSASYDNERGRETFFGLCEMAGRVDLLIAYLPEASMGTAVEMWQAHRHGVPIVSLSPMVENWVVRFLSDRVCHSLEELESILRQESEALLPVDR